MNRREVFFVIRRDTWVRITSILIVIIGVFWLVFWILNARLGPVVAEMSKARATNLATRAISNAVYERVGDQLALDQLLHTEKDKDGQIVYLQINTAQANKLAAEASLAVHEALKDLSHQEVYIPLGQIFGTQLFAGRGPKIPVRIVPVGAVESFVQEEFLAQGINQTSYKLYIIVTATVSIAVPLVRTQSTVQANIPVASVIIPGAVPQVYLDSSDSPLKQLLTPKQSGN
jgi:sporulation protein YunB